MGDCIYYKHFLRLKEIDIKFIQECINVEMKAEGYIVLYRSPSQSQDDFKTFLKNFELNLNKILANNSFLNVVLGGFSVKSNLWCKSDKT